MGKWTVLFNQWEKSLPFLFLFFFEIHKKVIFLILANKKSKILVVEKKLCKVFKFSNAKSWNSINSYPVEFIN